VWSKNPKIQVHKLMVSLSLLVIIVGRLVILGQIVIYWDPTGLGLSRMLWGKVKLKILPHQNMSLHIGDIKGKGNVICKNANHNSAENVKKHSNKRSLPTCHHCGITNHIQPKCPQLQAQKSKVQKKLPTRATSGTLPLTALQAPKHQHKFVLANQSDKPKRNKSRR